MNSFNRILAAVETRYDHQSARIILAEALEKAGISDKKNFEPKEISALEKALTEVGDNMEGVLAAIQEDGVKQAPAPEKKAVDKAPGKPPARKSPAKKKK